MSEAKPVKVDGWTALMNSLSPDARAMMEAEPAGPLTPRAAPPEDDGAAAYREMLSQLSPEAQAAFGGDPPAADVVRVDKAAARYGLVECLEGEWAQVRQFKSPEGLARRIAQLQGQDAVLWAFYGVVLPFTKGPQRFLLLPGETAVQIPVYEGGPARLVGRDEVGDVPVEESGYVGPRELSESHLPVPAEGGGDEEEEDDE